MRKPQPLDSAIVARYEAGESAAAIAECLGVVRRTVYNALERAGIERRRKLNFTTEAQQQKIADLYRAGASAETVAEKFGVDRMTVYNILERRGVPRWQRQTILDEQQRSEVASACVGGATLDAAAAKFSVSRSTVSEILRERDISLQAGRPRSCGIDDGVFDVLTPESLYWMGFLFADGCVYRGSDGQASLICGLAVKDLSHLEKLRAFCRSTHKIRHYTAKAGSGGGVIVGERDHVYWRVRSNRLCDALESRGIVTKRTRAPVPELAESRDFWRGCVDGDGSIGVFKAGSYNYPSFMLCGQKTILESFQSFLQKNGLADLRIVPTQSGIWCIETKGSNAFAIITALYKDAIIALERKLARAQLMFSGDFSHSVSYEKPARVKT